jgi:hypothetical protein
MQDFSQSVEGNPDRMVILIPGWNLRQWAVRKPPDLVARIGLRTEPEIVHQDAVWPDMRGLGVQKGERILPAIGGAGRSAKGLWQEKARAVIRMPSGD